MRKPTEEQSGSVGGEEKTADREKSAEKEGP